jgi:hypothetical protein
MLPTLLFALQAIENVHTPFPAGYVDYFGELSIDSNFVVPLGDKKQPLRIESWKKGLDTALRRKNELKPFLASTERQLREQMKSPKFSRDAQTFATYVRNVLAFTRPPSNVEAELLRTLRMPFDLASCVYTRPQKSEAETLKVWLIQGPSLMGDTYKRIAEDSLSLLSPSYGRDFYFANALRYNPTDADVLRFRSLSKELANRYPLQATPHFTLAMTLESKSSARAEARKYLSLEKRDFKTRWIESAKRIVERNN